MGSIYIIYLACLMEISEGSKMSQTFKNSDNPDIKKDIAEANVEYFSCKLKEVSFEALTGTKYQPLENIGRSIWDSL